MSGVENETEICLVSESQFRIGVEVALKNKEKDNLMYKLFGISSKDEEAKAYWDNVEYDSPE